MMLRTFVQFCFTKDGILLLSTLSICVYIKVHFSLSQSKKTVCKGHLQHISASHCLGVISSFLLEYCCCCSNFSINPHECSARFRHTKNSPYPNHSLDSLTAVKYIFFLPQCYNVCCSPGETKAFCR